MSESAYKTVINDYMDSRLTVDEFVDSYMKLWGQDRDYQWQHKLEYESFDPRFRRLIDRLFTSCDCYHENPEGNFELSETELKKEVQLLSYIWWGHPKVTLFR